MTDGMARQWLASSVPWDRVEGWYPGAFGLVRFAHARLGGEQQGDRRGGAAGRDFAVISPFVRRMACRR